MTDDFRFGDADATPVSDAKGGCCGKPQGCNIDSLGCLHKVEKLKWWEEAREELYARLKPGYALCHLPAPTPLTKWTCPEYGCGAEFFTDELGEFWMHRWCDDHGEADRCPDALQRIYSIPEYQRLTAVPVRTIEEEKAL